MLTRQERKEIAERAKACKKEEDLNWDQFSYVLLGIQSWRNDDELLDRLIELCDTSNMIELPLDKYGEVIRVGDTVYDKDGEEGKVGGYYYNNGTCKIIIPYGENGWNINFYPSEITHKKPVTIESLVERFKHVLEKGEMSYWAVSEISDIVDQLKKLGDSDD